MASPAAAFTIATVTHGRYLVRVPAGHGPWPLLVGFHGYAEHAERQMRALEQIPGADRWLLVAVQGLHRFYHRHDTVVASWMTRQDRELAIADNVAYVGAVLAAVRAAQPARDTLVFAGFSQGVGMAYRAAAHYRADAVIALAGDVPPDVAAGPTAAVPPVLIGRGSADPHYTDAVHAADLATLQRLGVTASSCIFDGGHEWQPAFAAAAGELLARLA